MMGINGGTGVNNITAIANNTITNLSTTGAGPSYGIATGSNVNSTVLSIYGNRIYNNSTSHATGVIYGINNAGGATGMTSNIYNNLVTDLRAPSSSGNN